jgi:hypothetical protein
MHDFVLTDSVPHTIHYNTGVCELSNAFGLQSKSYADEKFAHGQACPIVWALEYRTQVSSSKPFTNCDPFLVQQV